jgi:hypothetical protein
MDIRTQRNLEKLLRLMDVKPGLVAPLIEIRDGAFQIFLEFRESRVFVSATRAVDPVRAGEALQRLLARWSPAAMEGVPLRAFCADDGVFVSVAVPKGSGADFWYRIVNAQRSLLERCVKEES